jgi:hypothetical protein
MSQEGAACLQRMLGAKVTLTGLKAKPELNGAHGTVVADRGDGRWAVELEHSLQTLSISGKNLVRDLPPVGPSFAQSTQKAVDSIHDWPNMQEKGAHLPSFSGPAKDCRHGGPPPSDPTTAMFIPAMIGFMEEATAAHNRAVTSARENGDNVLSAVVQSEMNVLFRYWSRPEMASVVRPGSFKVAFSCAVDATLDSDFDTARQFVLVRFCATLQSTAVRRCLLIGRQLLRQVTRSWRGTLSRRNACTRRARTAGSRSTSRCRSRTPAPASHMTPWTRSSGRRGLGNAKLASSSCPPHG